MIGRPFKLSRDVKDLLLLCQVVALASISFKTSWSLNDKRRGEGALLIIACSESIHTASTGPANSRNNLGSQTRPIMNLTIFWKAEQKRMTNTESSCNGMSWSPVLRDDCELSQNRFHSLVVSFTDFPPKCLTDYDFWWLLNPTFKQIIRACVMIMN